MSESSNNTQKRHFPNYLVTSEELLYRIADKGYLDKLCRVAPSKKVEGTRVWFFDKDPVIWEMIREYKAEQNAHTANTEIDKKMEEVT